MRESLVKGFGLNYAASIIDHIKDSPMKKTIEKRFGLNNFQMSKFQTPSDENEKKMEQRLQVQMERQGQYQL